MVSLRNGKEVESKSVSTETSHVPSLESAWLFDFMKEEINISPLCM